MQNENILCLIVVSFLLTHIIHMNGTNGVASHSFCFKYLFVHCTFRPSDWRSAVGNLQFFDPQVAAYIEGINKDLFREREKQTSF